MIRFILFLLIPICFTSQNWVANDISGVWINTDLDGHIKIFPSYGKFYGQIVWMKIPNDSVTGKPQLDIHNNDPKLRSRPVMNMIILEDLEFDADEQEWKDGTLYNPKTGTTYDMFCKLKDKNTLEMHFYLSFRSIGKLYYWTRIKE